MNPKPGSEKSDVTMIHILVILVILGLFCVKRGTKKWALNLINYEFVILPEDLEEELMLSKFLSKYCTVFKTSPDVALSASKLDGAPLATMVCVCIHIYVNTYTYMRTCILLPLWYMYIYTYTHIYIYTHTHVYIYAYIMIIAFIS